MERVVIKYTFKCMLVYTFKAYHFGIYTINQLFCDVHPFICGEIVELRVFLGHFEWPHAMCRRLFMVI